MRSASTLASHLSGDVGSRVRCGRRVLKRALKADGIKGYTLDMDATGIEAEKQSAQMTYKGYTGYMPMVGHLAENGLIVGDEFREGNDSPGSRNFEFLQYCERRLPKGKKIKAFRSDSAAYQAKVINHCQDNGIEFAIGGDLDSAVKDVIRSIKEDEWHPYQNGFIGETVHSMNETKEAFRLVVIRRPYQGNLFDEEESTQKYTLIATSRGGSAEEVVQWYNQRGQCSENRIKELKIGFGMERMPCGQFGANAVFFRIGVLAYNVGRLFVLSTLDISWHRHQVQTLRWKLYERAGKIVLHGGYIYLKVSRSVQKLFEKVRLRSWEFAHA